MGNVLLLTAACTLAGCGSAELKRVGEKKGTPEFHFARLGLHLALGTVYGPEARAFDGTWKPGDFQEVKA